MAHSLGIRRRILHKGIASEFMGTNGHQRYAHLTLDESGKVRIEFPVETEAEKSKNGSAQSLVDSVVCC